MYPNFLGVRDGSRHDLRCVPAANLDVSPLFRASGTRVPDAEGLIRDMALHPPFNVLI